MGLLRYYITQTNKRLDSIDNKLDQLMALRSQILTVASMVSGGIAVVVAGVISYFIDR